VNVITFIEFDYNAHMRMRACIRAQCEQPLRIRKNTVQMSDIYLSIYSVSKITTGKLLFKRKRLDSSVETLQPIQ